MRLDVTNRLFLALERVGWKRESDRIVAPNATIWLSQDVLQSLGIGTWQEMQSRMDARLQRISANRGNWCENEEGLQDWQRSYEDTLSLVRCLGTVLEEQ
jgi:hypothetical protein